MSLRRLVLWRHGETDYNAAGRMQGHLDSALTDVGWNQARFAVAVLARFAPEVVVSSDLHRAADTASVFTEATGLTLRIDKRLRETNLGSWQGLTGPQIDADSPGSRQSWYSDPGWAPPGGESKLDVAQRAAETVGDLDGECHGTVLLATHGGLITALVGKLLGLPPAYWLQLGGIDNCHWSVLQRRESRWRLHTYNAGITG